MTWLYKHVLPVLWALSGLGCVLCLAGSATAIWTARVDGDGTAGMVLLLSGIGLIAASVGLTVLVLAGHDDD